MPYSAHHKQQSRERILSSAYKLFSSRGYDSVSINEVMADAGMTRGGFYAHFTNKNELYRESILYAANASRATRPKPDDIDEKGWVLTLLHAYLSKENVSGTCACPLASLANDVTVREPEVREAYTNTFKGLNSVIGSYAKAFSTSSSDTLLATTAMMIGGLAVARALNDDALAERLLNSCRVEAQSLLEGKSNI